MIKKVKDILTLIKWRDEVKEKKKARAIQKVIDKMVSKMEKRNTMFADGGIKVSEYAILNLHCQLRGLKIEG